MAMEGCIVCVRISYIIVVYLAPPRMFNSLEKYNNTEVNICIKEKKNDCIK